MRPRRPHLVVQGPCGGYHDRISAQPTAAARVLQEPLELVIFTETDPECICCSFCNGDEDYRAAGYCEVCATWCAAPNDPLVHGYGLTRGLPPPHPYSRLLCLLSYVAPGLA